jgi:alpha-L-fucosidase
MSAKKIILPTRRHIEWADSEIGVLIHYDIQVFEPSYDFRSQRGYQPSPRIFDPYRLNTDKWIESACAAGAKYAVLVAKHCSGFCLWPTEAYPYSVKNAAWKNGGGDIVGDFFRSCKKYGIKPGLYYSASCNAYLNVDNPGKVLSGDPADQLVYNDIVIRQLTELWTKYGDIFEIWFDGGCLPVEQGGPDIEGLLKKLQPDAVVFQGPKEIKNGLRWVGNENGEAPADCYATVNSAHENFDGSAGISGRGGDPWGDTWRPAESDIPGRDASRSYMGGWFWRAGEDEYVFSAEYLFGRYLVSVGRNTNLLIGMAIDDRGEFPEKDSAALSGFGKMVKDAFSSPIAEYKGSMNLYEYYLPVPKGKPAYLVIEEDISFGERILGFSVNGAYTGKAVGHKRIVPLEGIDVDGGVLFKITDVKDEPRLRSIRVF